MKTLFEKRLDELEARIPVYLVQINDQQKTMQKMFDFPNDLSSVRDMCESLTALLKSHIELSNTNVAKASSQISSSDKKLSSNVDDVASMKEKIQEMSKSISTHNASLNELNRNLNSLKDSHSGTREKVDNQSKAYSTLAGDVKNMTGIISSGSDFQSASQVQSKTTMSALRTHDDKFEEINQKLITMASGFNRLLEDSLKKASLELKAKMNERSEIVLPTVKNYDPEISDIKKDIAMILQVVHATASKEPQSDAMNDKVKTLEKSIAQIYGLLKKYER
jgi:DNA repair exonuclease SbcCD ATPase subunit